MPTTTTAPDPRTTTLELHAYDTPARDLPFGMIAEVLDVLKFHGLTAAPLAVVMALGEVVRNTPAAAGGRTPDSALDANEERDLLDQLDDCPGSEEAPRP